MSNPSFDNIDKWLFEYMEGNLSSHQESRLKQFLLQNPGLEQDLDAWQNAKVDATSAIFPNIDSHVRKPIAWWIPTAAVSLVIGVSALGWFNANLEENSLLVADSAHTINTTYVAKTIEKGESYFEAKTNSQKPNNFFDISGLVIPNYNSNWNYSFPICGGVIIDNDMSQFYAHYPIDNGITFSNQIFTDENTLTNENEINENVISTNSKTAGSESNSDELKVDELEKNARAMSRTENKFGSTYNKSFSSKMKSMVRKVIRMTDNPVALTNSKDIFYHTPGMQTLDVNFGSVGSLLTPRLQSVSRAQWTGRGNQQISNQLSFDTYVKSIRGGIGVQVNHVYYGGGAYQIGQFALMYSPKFAISKNVVIEPAIRFKMGNKRLYNQKMIPGQLVEMDRQNLRTYSSEGVENKSQDLWYKDVGLALMSNTKWFSAGIQIDNIGRHYNNVYNSSTEKNRQGYHLTATVGTDYVSRTKLFSFSPYIMYQKVENLSEIWGGSIFRYKKLTMGGGYSSLGDYAGSIGIKTNRLMMTYSVDFTQSIVMNERLLSQQLTLRLLTNRNRKDYRMLNL